MAICEKQKMKANLYCK